MKKTIVLPAEKSEQICLPNGFNQFLSFFGVVHDDGRNEIRWFVQSPEEVTCEGDISVKHEDDYERYDMTDTAIPW